MLTDTQRASVITSLQSNDGDASGIERRQQPRTAVRGQALIIRCDAGKERKPFYVLLRDVSAGGIGILHGEAMRRGERFVLILPPSMNAIAKAVLCTVAFVRHVDDGFEIGASFTSLIQPRNNRTPPGEPQSPAALPALPVPALVRAFRDQLKDVLSEQELAVIQSIERRLSQPACAAQQAPPVQPPARTAPPLPAKPAEPNPAAAPRAVGEVRQLMSRDDCIKRAEQAMQVRTLSGVVGQVISLATSPRSDLSDLASLVVRDPILSARILQAANRVSYTSTRGVVSSIPEAVRNIGCAAVRDIAATLGVFDAMPPSEADGFNPIRCWQHSFAVATSCQRLAAEEDKGQAYLVGLCHDLGEILFHSHFGTEYRQVMAAQEATGRRRDELERMMLGMSHGELVSTILRCLGLPDAVRAPIDEYHAQAASGRAVGNPMTRVLRLADLYANGVLLASSGQSPIHPFTKPECRSATGVECPEQPDGVSLRGEVFGLTGMLARLSSKEEAELMSPLYAPSKARLWLARDPALSSYDPVAAAIQSLADLRIRDALPRADELAECEGVVVLSRSTSAAGFTGPEIAKALGGGSTPVLWLTGRVDGAACGGPSLVPTLWPIPLAKLAEFVYALQ